MLQRIIALQMAVISVFLAVNFAGAALAENHTDPDATEEDVAGVEFGIDTALAKVGDTEISLGHVMVATMDLTEEEQQKPPEEIYQIILERLIKQEAAAQAAGEISVLTRLQLENHSRAIIAAQTVETVANEIAIGDADVVAAYEAEYGDIDPDIEYNASHILVETEQDAQAILTDLAGGSDFAVLARTKSTGPSGPSGGNLGWFGKGRMLPEFEAAVVALDVGATSDPVQTPFGWHVIRLNETRSPNRPSFEDVSGDLSAELRRKAFSTRIMEIIDAASVERFTPDGLDPTQFIADSIPRPDD